MADPADSPFATALARHLAAGTNGVSSQRQLAVRLASIKRTTVESERRAVGRHLRGEIEPEEESIVAYAEAFGVKRSTFPPAADPRRKAQQQIAERAATIERSLTEMARVQRRRLREAAGDQQAREELSQSLRELEATVEVARELRRTLEADPGRSGARAAANGGAG